MEKEPLSREVMYKWLDYHDSRGNARGCSYKPGANELPIGLSIVILISEGDHPDRAPIETVTEASKTNSARQSFGIWTRTSKVVAIGILGLSKTKQMFFDNHGREEYEFSDEFRVEHKYGRDFLESYEDIFARIVKILPKEGMIEEINGQIVITEGRGKTLNEFEVPFLIRLNP